MTVWYHLSTIFRQRFDRSHILRVSGLLALCVALITTLFFGINNAKAQEGINETISFQGRLLDSQGAPVPDGHYNIQFKIYQDGTGKQTDNPSGTLEWTETYINNNATNGVEIKNGYLSVNLGSKTSFGDSVDWNQDTLWLSMNIAGSSTLCTTFGSAPCFADGEMLPMKRLTSSPYALNSGKLNGKTSDDFIHNSTNQQTGNFNINGTGVASVLQGNTSVIAPLFDRADAGSISIGETNATTISIGSANNDQTIAIGNGDGVKSVTVGSTFGSSQTTIQGGTGGVAVNLVESSALNINNPNSQPVLTVGSDNTIATGTDSQLIVNGDATLEKGLTSNGTIVIASPDKTAQLALGWGGENSIGQISSSSNALALQGNGLSLLTAINNGGVANIGIGNTASSGYALDVTGSTNTSNQYLIDGKTALSNSGLSFSGAATSTISSATGQNLNLESSEGVSISVDGNALVSATEGNVQIGSGTGTGTPTVLTLDQASNAPTIDPSLLGSMYYDTTLGKVQCYEADGWGDCGNSPDVFVTMTPEYSNSVIREQNTGSLTSDLCSDSLGINNGSSGQAELCGTNEGYNFYALNAAALEEESATIYVNYKLPANFTGFSGSSSLTARADNAIDSSVSYSIIIQDGSGQAVCNPTLSTTGASWKQHLLDLEESCTAAAGDTVTFVIDLSANNESSAYVSNLEFAYKTH